MYRRSLVSAPVRTAKYYVRRLKICDTCREYGF